MADSIERGLTAIAAAPAPLRHPSRQPSDHQTATANRWKAHWEPLCAAASKDAFDPHEAFSKLRITYYRRIETLLRANISWAAILRKRLDSPLTTPEEFDRVLGVAIALRKCHLGQRKGKG